MNGFEWIDPFLERWISQNENARLQKEYKDFEVRSMTFKPYWQYFIDISKPNEKGQFTLLIVRDIPGKHLKTIKKKEIRVDDPNDLPFYLDQAYGLIVEGF